MTAPQTFLNGKVRLFAGDCLAVLPTLPENSIDSCVTDPPYHLASIVKRWSGNGPPPVEGVYRRSTSGFMGKAWDGGDIAFQPETWAEVLRVLKPGGHLLAFAAPRNAHRMFCAIEDAGFEIRDTIMWIFGSGFPKSHDVSKGIDRMAGAEREVVGSKLGQPGYSLANNGCTNKVYGDLHDPAAECAITAPATDAARQWEGWGTALKPAHEPICLARKPLSEGTVAANVLRWGVGALNIDGCRVGTSGGGGNGLGSHFDRLGDTEPKVKFRDDRTGTLGRWPANIILSNDDEVVSAFPEAQGGGSVSNRASPKTKGIYGDFRGEEERWAGYADTGSAARFFASFPRKDDEWNSPANGAEPCLLQCHPRYGGSALLSVPWQPPSSLVQNVKSAGNLCDSCATAIALALAELPLNPNLAGVLSQASISERNLQILSRSLALYAEGRESTDTITTTKSLKILLGSVSHAIAEAISLERSVTKANIGSGQKRLHYTSKADADDRIGSKHPTVKPLDLMQYLVRLVTPRGGTVLDPFAGTGTTGEAAWREGCNTILIEREPEYIADIERRMALALAGPDERARESIKARLKDKPVDHGPLFDGAAA